MRLVGSIPNEKEAYLFYSFLLKEGIQNVYEPSADPKAGAKTYLIWVVEEDDFPVAAEWLDRFKTQPNAPPFIQGEQPFIPPVSPPSQAIPPLAPSKAPRSPLSYSLTHFFLLLCSFLFLWNGLQEAEIEQANGPLAVEIDFTPLQRALMFDEPRSLIALTELIAAHPLKSFTDFKQIPPQEQELFNQAQAIPYWKGIFDLLLHGRKEGAGDVRAIPLFEKIRQGEIWRLFTPCLLHRDFLHILFNMAWLWILGRQMEERLPRWKMLLLFLIIGVLSNVAQYLVDGPYFLGFSGIVVGMVGFIWVRQRAAPWEGYPLHRGTVLFVLVFVGAMFALELVSIGMQLFSQTNLSAHIANTAHIVGGLIGMLLGKSSFFSRRRIGL